MRVAQLAPFVAACKPLCQRRHAPCLQPAAPRLQVANLVFFVADGALQFWTGVSLTIPALLVGCCAGTLYVQTFTAIDRELEPCKRELALSTASAGTPAGILLADLTGLVGRRAVVPVQYPAGQRRRCRGQRDSVALSVLIRRYVRLVRCLVSCTPASSGLLFFMNI